MSNDLPRLELCCWTISLRGQRVRSIQIGAVVYADAEPVNQFSSEPTRDYRSKKPEKGHDVSDRGNVQRIRVTKIKADGEKQHNDNVTGTVNSANRFCACIRRNGHPVDQAENRGQQPGENAG